jgi:hypothetical protein
MAIEAYRFGQMIINGAQFTKDLILYDDHIKSDWWRQKGHELCVADIQHDIEKFTPTMLVVGTGKFGMLKVLPETAAYLSAKNIKVIDCRTGEAVNVFNELSLTEKVMGAFHLTC